MLGGGLQRMRWLVDSRWRDFPGRRRLSIKMRTEGPASIVGPMPLHLSNQQPPVKLPPSLVALNLPLSFQKLALNMPSLSSSLLLPSSSPSSISALDLISELRLPQHLQTAAMIGYNSTSERSVKTSQILDPGT